MAVGKKKRFEVFKRDAFTCQYCGRTPPTVTLECDHVVAVANGGTDEEHNLITSCFDCNRGKRDIPLTVVVPAVAERIEREKEVSEQVTEYNEFLASQKAVMDANIDEVGRVWFNQFKRRKDHWAFGPSRVPSIRTFLRKLTLTEVLEAVEIAHERIAVYKDDDNKTFRYFCGVCWNLIRAKESGV